MRIPNFALAPETLLNRTTVIYGPSGSGKTVLIRSCISALRDSLSAAFILAPTNATNHTYSDVSPPPLIFTDFSDGGFPASGTKGKPSAKALAIDFLNRFFERQIMRKHIFDVVHDVDVLRHACHLLPDAARRAAEAGVAEVEACGRRCLEKITRGAGGATAAKVREANELITTAKVAVYRKVIIDNFSTFRFKVARVDSTDESYTNFRYVADYIDINPNILLVLDDYAAQIKSILNEPRFRQLFYQSRHYCITCIIACQDDTDLAPALRKNVFVSVFTRPETTETFFAKNSSGFPKTRLGVLKMAVEAVFAEPHRKLVYVSGNAPEAQFFSLTGAVTDAVRVGSDDLWDFCQSIQGSDGERIGKDNHFKSIF